MAVQLTLIIELHEPTAGVQYGIQKGQGANYVTIQQQVASGENLLFEFTIEAKMNKGAWMVYGPFTQGSPHERFFYIDIGTYAGQKDSPFGRRLKIPLKGITDFIATDNKKMTFKTHVPGTGKDGGPNSGTVKPFEGWRLIP